jgi:hypothetical protein
MGEKGESKLPWMLGLLAHVHVVVLEVGDDLV